MFEADGDNLEPEIVVEGDDNEESDQVEPDPVQNGVLPPAKEDIEIPEIEMATENPEEIDHETKETAENEISLPKNPKFNPVTHLSNKTENRNSTSESAEVTQGTNEEPEPEVDLGGEPEKETEKSNLGSEPEKETEKSDLGIEPEKETEKSDIGSEPEKEAEQSDLEALVQKLDQKIENLISLDSLTFLEKDVLK